MKRGFFGLTSPTTEALRGILVGSQRGILWICPLLILLPVGVWRMLSTPSLRSAGVLSTLIVSYYVLLNSSYHYWNGGWSTGPRHITAMLPFACLAIGAAWQRGGIVFRLMASILTVASFGIALLCTTVGMFAPDTEPELIVGYLLPGLLSGASTAAPVKLGFLRAHHFSAVFALLAIAASTLLYRAVTTPRVGGDRTV